jgi:uncharacterized protein
MKSISCLAIFIVSILFQGSACAQDRRFSNPVGYINDFNNLFLPSEVASLDSIVRAFEKETTAQIAVVTVDTTFSSYDKFDSTVIALHNEWGVGAKEKNNGVLIVICPAYRLIRINNGYGTEEKLTNEETKRIIDSIIVPQFREAKFYEGTRDAILAIMKKIR